MKTLLCICSIVLFSCMSEKGELSHSKGLHKQHFVHKDYEIYEFDNGCMITYNTPYSDQTLWVDSAKLSDFGELPVVGVEK